MSPEKNIGNSEEKIHADTQISAGTQEISQSKFKQLSLNTILVSIALIIATVAIVEGVVFWLHSQHRVTQAVSTVDQLKLDLVDYKNKLEQLSDQAEKTQDLIAMEQKHLEKTSSDVQTLLRSNTKSSADWQLLEVNHLLRLADMALRFNRDVPGAIALLENAKQGLNNINSASLQELQTSIATIILSLKSLPTVNLADIITNMNAIKSQITRLPLQITLANDEIKQPTSPASKKTNVPEWRRAWDESLAELKDIVVIRRHDKPVEPLISPQQQSYLSQHLSLMLEQAQWAAIHGQEDTYKLSLQQAMKWIKQFYNLQNPATESVLRELEALEKIQITRSLPDIAATQSQLQELISQRAASTVPIEKKTPDKSQDKILEMNS